MFPVSKAANGLFVRGVNDEVKAADALDRHDLSAANSLHRIPHCLGVSGENGAVGIPEFQVWPTGRAGIRLRMKSAFVRILVFGSAGLAHDESSHRGVRPIVRECQDDGEAGSTIRAVGEGIPITSVRGVEDLAKTIVARADIGEDERRWSPGAVTLPDFEGLETRGRQKTGFQALDR
jgi:hypothetical protein